MKYAYLGDHESVDLYGVHFPVGVFIAVENPVLLKKLAGNNHFEAECKPADVINETPAVTPQRRGRKAKLNA